MNLPVTAWFTQALLVIVAALLGSIARYIGQKFAWSDFWCFFIGLLVFGLVLIFVHVS